MHKKYFTNAKICYTIEVSLNNMKGQKMRSTTEIIWEKVRYYNELSHVYSEIADKLTKLAQDMEN